MIIVAGEALIDLVVHPDLRVEAVPGGGPFNVARTIARLGGTVAFLGRLSADRFGRLLRDRLEADGVDLSLVVATDDPTTLSVAELDEAGAATYRFHAAGTAAAGLRPADLPDIGRPPALHVGTLGLVLEPLADTIEMLVSRVPADTLVMVDINARPAAIADRERWADRVTRILARADIVTGSHDDLRTLRPGAAAEATAGTLLDLGPRAVLLTDGPRQTRIVTPRGVTSLEPPRVEVIDTVGAGDAFVAGYLSGDVQHWTIEQKLARANACGALMCTIPGDWEASPT
ncbi:MAG: carbohydrate kinase family protein, partial [Candidatus Limnocylindrales bacterium]